MIDLLRGKSRISTPHLLSNNKELLLKTIRAVGNIADRKCSSCSITVTQAMGWEPQEKTSLPCSNSTTQAGLRQGEGIWKSINIYEAYYTVTFLLPMNEQILIFIFTIYHSFKLRHPCAAWSIYCSIFWYFSFKQNFWAARWTLKIYWIIQGDHQRCQLFQRKSLICATLECCSLYLPESAAMT